MKIQKYRFNMIKINHKKLHRALIIKMKKLDIPQRTLSRKQGFSRSSLHRLNVGKPITLDLFFNLVSWLDEDPNEYLLKEYITIDGKKKDYEMKEYLN